MPRFLQQAFHLDLKQVCSKNPNVFIKNIIFTTKLQNGLLSSLPYLSQALVGWTLGFVCDKLYQTNRFRLGTLRKTFNTIGFFGPAICLFLITVVERDPFWNIALIVLAMATNGGVLAGFQVTHVDMSPNFASSLMGITNCVSNFAGIFSTIVTSTILSLVAPEQEHNLIINAWNYVFYLCSIVYIITATLFVLFGSNELQKWNDPDKELI